MRDASPIRRHTHGASHFSAPNCKKMKIIKRGPDFLKFRISSEDDLWTTAKLCNKGRKIGMLGERRDQTTAGEEGGRAKSAVRKKYGLN